MMKRRTEGYSYDVDTHRLSILGLVMIAGAGCTADLALDPVTVTRIGPEGGVATSHDGNLTLTLAAGAVNESTDISIRYIGDTDMSGNIISDVYTLTPTGLRFNAQAELAISIPAGFDDAAIAQLSGDAPEALPGWFEPASRRTVAILTFLSSYGWISPHRSGWDGGPGPDVGLIDVGLDGEPGGDVGPSTSGSTAGRVGTSAPSTSGSTGDPAPTSAPSTSGSTAGRVGTPDRSPASTRDPASMQDRFPRSTAAQAGMRDRAAVTSSKSSRTTPPPKRSLSSRIPRPFSRPSHRSATATGSGSTYRVAARFSSLPSPIRDSAIRASASRSTPC